MPSDNISKNTSKLYLINEKNKTIKNWNEQINHNNIVYIYQSNNYNKCTLINFMKQSR